MGPNPEERPTTARLLASLFLISLVVRVAFLLPVAGSGVPPLHDESGHYARAVAFARIGASLVSGAAPARAELAEAYHHGVWPPLHSLLLAVPLALFGADVSVARAAVALLSALTTPLVFLLAARLSTRRAALWAAGAHVAYPGFIAFSHLLWSETTFLFFLLATVLLTLRVAGDASPRRRGARAALAGAALGATVLTRAAGVPFLALVPLWLWWRMRGTGRASVALPALVAGIALAALAPWQATIFRNEGRAAFVSSAAGSNLFLGNNPWSTDEETSREAKLRVKAAITAASRERSIPREAAARALAFEHIGSHPIDFLGGLATKFRVLCMLDGTVLRHVLGAAYPPMPGWVVALVWGALVVGLVTLIGGGVAGLVAAREPALRERGLLVVCLAGAIAPPLATIASTRMALPALVLLCPAFGHAAAAIARGPGTRRTLLVALAAGSLLTANVATLARSENRGVGASSHYAPLVARVTALFSWRARFSDVVEFRAVEGAPGGTVRLAIDSEGWRFGGAVGDTAVWQGIRQQPRFVVEVVRHAEGGARDGASPGLAIIPPDGSAVARIEPVGRAAWRRWTPTGSPGLEYRWVGGLRAAATASGDSEESAIDEP